MPTITITDQEKSLLNLIAKGEAAAGVDPYTSLWPGTSEPSLVQMTCAEVQRFQTQRIAQGYRSTACGRYQFIKRTLTEAIRVAEIDPLTTRYTPDVQDYLILAILKRYRKLNEWVAGTYTTDRFMIKLSQEFASIPVPYQMQGQSRVVNKGQSYYAGDGLNRAHHDPDSLYQQLNDILNGGTGESTTVDVLPSGPSGALPELGTSPRTQVARSTAGAGVGAVSGQGRPNSQPVSSSTLPGSTTVYVYEVIDPLDDRYDFRTGKKVKDILVHGVSAAAASPHVETNIGQANVASTNIGVVPPGVTVPETATTAASEISEAEQTQALEGNAPVTPTPTVPEAPCPAPVSAPTQVSNTRLTPQQIERLATSDSNSNNTAPKSWASTGTYTINGKSVSKEEYDRQTAGLSIDSITQGIR